MSKKIVPSDAAATESVKGRADRNAPSLNRRQMLCWLTACSCAPAWLPTSSSLGQGTLSAGGCTLGFSTYGMESIATERAFKLLSGMGYDSVEIAVRSGWDADSANLDPERRDEIRNVAEGLALRITSLMEHVAATSDAGQKIAIERLKLAAALAHDLSPQKPPLVQTVLGGGDFNATKEKVRDRLAEWVRIADASDVVFAIKPHRGGVVSKPSEAVWLLEQLGKPDRLRMVYDYSHYAFRDLPMDETIDVALPYTAHIAVKDPAEQNGRVVFKLPGEAGTIDFANLIRRFYDGGYRGDVSCEVSSMVSKQPAYDPIAAANVCYKNVAAAFERSGVPRG